MNSMKPKKEDYFMVFMEDLAILEPLTKYMIVLLQLHAHSLIILLLIQLIQVRNVYNT